MIVSLDRRANRKQSRTSGRGASRGACSRYVDGVMPNWSSFFRSVMRCKPRLRAAAAHCPWCLPKAASNNGGSTTYKSRWRRSPGSASPARRRSLQRRNQLSQGSLCVGGGRSSSFGRFVCRWSMASLWRDLDHRDSIDRAPIAQHAKLPYRHSESPRAMDETIRQNE